MMRSALKKKQNKMIKSEEKEKKNKKLKNQGETIGIKKQQLG